MKPFRDIFILVKKDILDELRGGGALISMLVFALLVIVIFSFAFGTLLSAQKELSAGLLWVTFVFASTLGLNYSFSVEKENSAIKGLMLAPVDRSILYLGKLISNFVFIFIIELFTVPIFLVLFNYRVLEIIPQLLLVLFLGTAGICSVGTIFSSMSTSTKKGNILLPIILFPIIIPLLIGSIRCTSAIFLDESLISSTGSWIIMLVVYDVLFITISLLTYEFILEEL